jgi:hypothetical protein
MCKVILFFVNNESSENVIFKRIYESSRDIINYSVIKYRVLFSYLPQEKYRI